MDILFIISKLFFNFLVVKFGFFLWFVKFNKWWMVFVGKFVVLFICFAVCLVGVVSKIGNIFCV